MLNNSIFNAKINLYLVPQSLTKTDKKILDFFALNMISIEKNVKIEFKDHDISDDEIAEGPFTELVITDQESDKEISIVAPTSEIEILFQNKKMLIEDLNCITGISLFPNLEFGSLVLSLDN